MSDIHEKLLKSIDIYQKNTGKYPAEIKITPKGWRELTANIPMKSDPLYTGRGTEFMGIKVHIVDGLDSDSWVVTSGMPMNFNDKKNKQLGF